MPPWLVGRRKPTREESPEEVLCPTGHRLTPLGHPGGTGNRLREQGLGRLLTILPWYPLASNLACINEATPRGESPEAIRPEPDGQTAETPRTRSHTDMLAHRGCTATSPTRRICRTGLAGGEEPWCTHSRLVPVSGPGPGGLGGRRRRQEEEEQDKKRGTFCYRYVSVHSDAIMFPHNYADF